ncbi:MAG: efflux RND transporter permease subunit, partial [Bacillota bacterium]|nr:efflux RND transporter permease subunit [Bacillota bacterium]
KETEGRMNRAYKKILSIALDNRIKVVIVSIIIMALSFLLVSRIGLKFLPPDKTNIITANLKLPPGSSAEETNKETAKMEKFLSEDNDVELITSKIGSSSEEAAFGMMQGSNEAKVTIDLKKTSDLDKALIKIRNKANELSAGNSSWFVKPQDHYSGGEKLEIVVNGNNVDDIKSASELISSKIKDMPDLSNITNNLSDKKPEISVKVDSEKAAVKGLNPYLAAMQVRSLLNYDKVTSINLEGKTIDVQLGMDKKDIDSIDKVRNLQIKGGTGAQVTISDIGEVTLQDGPVSISERDGKRYASITADIFSEDTKKTSQDIVNRVEAIKSQLKPGVTYSIGGSMDDISDSFKQMGIAMLIAILLVFSIMVLAFKEATAPLAILFSLPFAAVGAMLALVITNHPLSMSGLVGILMLIGIVVTNAIVLVDRVQTNRRKGMSIRDALIEAGGVRLRPIIMTAAATIMAIFPLAAGFSEGAIISEELGIVVIGGLTLSTVLTLVIVPVVYSLLEGLKLLFSQSKESQFDIETDAQARFD